MLACVLCDSQNEQFFVDMTIAPHTCLKQSAGYTNIFPTGERNLGLPKTGRENGNACNGLYCFTAAAASDNDDDDDDDD